MMVDHVQIAMPSGHEQTARSFYVGILGFEEIPKPPELATRGGAWFRAGTVNIHLGVEEPFVPAKKAHLAFRCSNYDAFLHRLSSLGIQWWMIRCYLMVSATAISQIRLGTVLKL